LQVRILPSALENLGGRRKDRTAGPAQSPDSLALHQDIFGPADLAPNPAVLASVWVTYQATCHPHLCHTLGPKWSVPFDWTTVGVAVVTGATGVVAGVLGTRGSGQIAEAQRDHDFALRRDERRADVYTDLLTTTLSSLVSAGRIYPVFDFPGSPQPLSAPDEEEDIRLSARVTALGSEPVKKLTEEWASKQAAFAGCVTLVRQIDLAKQSGTFSADDWGGLSPTSARMKLNDAREELVKATDPLRAQIASELSPTPNE
jgi:hypothetical protein